MSDDREAQGVHPPFYKRRTQPESKEEADLRLALRHAARTVPGALVVIQDPQRGVADLINFLVDAYARQVEERVAETQDSFHKVVFVVPKDR